MPKEIALLSNPTSGKGKGARAASQALPRLREAGLMVRNLVGFYGAGELVAFGEFRHVARVLEAFLARPAVVRGLSIPARS